MSEGVQHLLVFAIVALSACFVLWQGVRALIGRRSRLGSCCAKGCGAGGKADAAPAKPQADRRVTFMPVEMLHRRR